MRMLSFGEHLKLARACDFNKVELYVDSWVMITTLYSSKVGMETTWSLLQHIRRPLDMN